MSEKIITAKDVEYVSKLARIRLKPEEISLFQGQLENILEYIQQLQAVDTDNVPPTAHPLNVSNVWREDEEIPFPNIPDLLKNAPDTEENYYKVKKVIE